MQPITNFINQIPVEAYIALGGSAVVSIILQAIKHFLSLQSDRVITTLLYVFSFMASAVQFLMQASPSNPTILGAHTAVVVGLSSGVYRFFIKPSYNLLSDAKKYRQEQLVKNSDVGL